MWPRLQVHPSREYLCIILPYAEGGVGSLCATLWPVVVLDHWELFIELQGQWPAGLWYHFFRALTNLVCFGVE